MKPEQLVTAYLEQSSGYTSRTLRLMQFWVHRLLGFAEDQGGLERLEATHLEAFRQELTWTPGPRGQLYAPHTVYQGMRMVRSFLRWAAEQGYLPVDPTRNLVLPRPPIRQLDQLSPAELEAVLEAVPPTGPIRLRDRAILETLVGTSLQLLPLLNLKLDDLDRERGLIHVPGQPAPMSGRLEQILERYLIFARPCFCYRDDQPLLFLNQQGKALLPPAVVSLVRQAGLRAGLAPGRANTRILVRSAQALADEFNRKRFTWSPESGTLDRC